MRVLGGVVFNSMKRKQDDITPIEELTRIQQSDSAVFTNEAKAQEKDNAPSSIEGDTSDEGDRSLEEGDSLSEEDDDVPQTKFKIGDSIMFQNLAFVMKVQKIKTCVGDHTNEPHCALQVIDPDGERDWICERDATGVLTMVN